MNNKRMDEASFGLLGFLASMYNQSDLEENCLSFQRVEAKDGTGIEGVLAEFDGPYVLTDGRHGALTTPALYATATDSICHVFEDGCIMRYGEQIGTVDDLEFVEAEEGENED